MGHFYCNGLQDFEFEEKYDVIWIQWVIGHLHDDDLLIFLNKCKQALAPNGLLCIKDNVCYYYLFLSLFSSFSENTHELVFLLDAPDM